MPDVDLNPGKKFEFQGSTYVLKTRYKIGKFFKALDTNPIIALEIIMEQESFDTFADLELSMEEFEEFMDKMSNALSGSNSKN